jgi:hypothetical protein
LGLGECAGKKGRQTTGPNPTDKGKAGWKRHFVADRGGLPLAVVLRALQTSMTRRSWKRPWMASSRSSGLLVGNPVGRARASEEAARRQSLRFPPLQQSLEGEEYNTTHRPPWDRLEREVGTAQVSGGAYLAWLSKYRRLSVRYERREDIHEAFLQLGCSLICLNHLP